MEDAVVTEIESDNLPYYVSGPSASLVVWGKQYIEGMIIALCHVNGDDEEGYTSTLVDEVDFTFPETSRAALNHVRGVVLH